MAVAKITTPDVEEVKEVKVDNVTFKFGDHTYTVDKNKIAEDLDILEAFEDGKIITPLKLLLGLKQWNAFKEREKPNAAKLGEFAEAMFDEIGEASPGE